LAEADAMAVADGAGPEAVEARLFLARLGLSEARELDDMGSARAVLLPAVGDPRVLNLLESMRMVELLAAQQAGDPAEALFAAGELARDRLLAPELARRLLLAYAGNGETRWAGKALLAALDLARAPTDRSPILRQMARMRNDPYVQAARTGGAPPVPVVELDQLLEVALSEVLATAAARARQLDILARERSDTIR
jgi:hypothetical protein